MEPWVVKRGKEEYVFHSDRRVMSRKGKLIHEIRYHEIMEITYNHRFGLRDFLHIIISGALSSYNDEYLPNALFIRWKSGGEEYYTRMLIRRDDFEKIRNIIPVPIELI
jgi:hypothetical protein